MRRDVIPHKVSILYTVDGSFDTGITALKGQKLEIYTAAELARLRIQAGPEHSVSTNWSWVGEGYVYMPNGDILIASRKYNPLIPNARAATKAHREDKEFFLEDKVAAALRDRAQKDPNEAAQSGVLLLRRKKVMAEYQTNCLADEAVPVFLFGDQARPYGAFLRAQGISSIPHYIVEVGYAKKQEQAFGRAFAVDGLLGRSQLSGYYVDLHGVNGRIGGVRSVPAERAARYVRNVPPVR